jgi:hypothetical protein
LSNTLSSFIERPWAFFNQTYEIRFFDNLLYLSSLLYSIPTITTGITNEKAASILQGTESTDDDQATVENDETQESTHDQDYIPWQISNKYYTADIHFQLADWNTLSPSLKSGIPAIVVIWEKGEVRYRLPTYPSHLSIFSLPVHSPNVRKVTNETT